MSRPNLSVTAVAIVSVFASGGSAERAGDLAKGLSVAIGKNARTEQVDALGFAGRRNRGRWTSIGNVKIPVGEYIGWFDHPRRQGEIGLVRWVHRRGLVCLG